MSKNYSYQMCYSAMARNLLDMMLGDEALDQDDIELKILLEKYVSENPFVDMRCDIPVAQTVQAVGSGAGTDTNASGKSIRVTVD